MRATEAQATALASPVAHGEHARASHREHAAGKNGPADFSQILGHQVAATGSVQRTETETKELPSARATSVTTTSSSTSAPSETGLATVGTIGTSVSPARILHGKDTRAEEPPEAITTSLAPKVPAIKVTHSATASSLGAPDLRHSPRELASPLPTATNAAKPPAEPRHAQMPNQSEPPTLQEKPSTSTPRAPKLEQGSPVKPASGNRADKPAPRLTAPVERRTETPGAAPARTATDLAKPAANLAAPPAAPSVNAVAELDTAAALNAPDEVEKRAAVETKPAIHASAKQQVVASGSTATMSELASTSPAPTVEPRPSKVVSLPVASERPDAIAEAATQGPVASTHVLFQQSPAVHLDGAATTVVTPGATSATTDVPPAPLQTHLHDSGASPKVAPQPPTSRAYAFYTNARTTTPPNVARQDARAQARASTVAQGPRPGTNAPQVRGPNDDAKVPTAHTKAVPAPPSPPTPRTSTLASSTVPTVVATSAPLATATPAALPSPTAPAGEKPAPSARHPLKASEKASAATNVARTLAAPVPPTNLSPPDPNHVSAAQDHSDVAAILDKPKAEAPFPTTAPVTKPVVVAHATVQVAAVAHATVQVGAVAHATVQVGAVGHAAVQVAAPTELSPRKPAPRPAQATAAVPSAQTRPAPVDGTLDSALPPPAQAAVAPPKGESSSAAGAPTRPSVVRPKPAAAITAPPSIAAGSAEKPAAEPGVPSLSPSGTAPAPQPPTLLRQATANPVSAAGPQGAAARTKNETGQPKKIAATTKHELQDRSEDRFEDRSNDRSDVDATAAAPAQAPHPTGTPTPTAHPTRLPHVEAKVAKTAERSVSEPSDPTSAGPKPLSSAPTPDPLAGQNAARPAPSPLVGNSPTVGTAAQPQTAIFTSTLDGPASSATAQTNQLVDRAINDPGLSVAVMPHAAHMSITSTTGDLALHVRVRDGNADVNVSGSMAPLFDSKAPEVRTVLAGEGLNLGSFATDQRGQSQHHHQPAEPAVRSEARPMPPNSRPTSSVPSHTDISDEHRIHVTA